MGSQARQVRQQLGLAFALAVCALLSGAVSGSIPDSFVMREAKPEFRLVRLAYNNGQLGGSGGFGRGGDAYETDAPEAEFHLTQGIRRLTRISTIDPGPQADWRRNVLPIRPSDPELFKYPFLYAVEVGRWYLDDEEAALMREYLLRGGFMMVDDFHGTVEWEGFWESMRKVFPDREWQEIPASHEAFHVLYDLNQKVQIPGTVAWRDRETCERCFEGGKDPHWRGIFDGDRLMVAINFNMDLGDAWEHADNPDYPQPWTALAYRFAISYALYAMTH